MSSYKCIYFIITLISAKIVLINIYFNEKRSYLLSLNFEMFELFNIAIELEFNNNLQLN